MKEAADVRFIGHSADGDSGTLLRFEVPCFGNAAPELLRQQRLWDDGPEPEQTAFELLGAALVDLAARGRIPAEESDEDFLAAVEDLS